MIGLPDTALRLLVATVLGAAVGFEREVHGQVAGARTHALVACGAALFTIVGAYGFRQGFGHASIDPTRVSAQIVSGIGFIGGGAILRDRGSIRGVTTAAALWASAALGMAAGVGSLLVAVTGVVIILAALLGLDALRSRGRLAVATGHRKISVVYTRGHGTLAPIIEAVEQAGGSLLQIRVQDDDGTEERRLELTVRARDRSGLEQALGRLLERPEVHDLEIEPR